MSKKTVFLMLLGIVISLPTITLAAPTVQSIVDAAVQITLYIASGVTVILWVVTGILFLTAQGDPAKLKEGKTALLAAVAGTILVIVATAAMNIVAGAFNL